MISFRVPCNIQANILEIIPDVIPVVKQFHSSNWTIIQSFMINIPVLVMDNLFFFYTSMVTLCCRFQVGYTAPVIHRFYTSLVKCYLLVFTHMHWREVGCHYSQVLNKNSLACLKKSSCTEVYYSVAAYNNIDQCAVSYHVSTNLQNQPADQLVHTWFACFSFSVHMTSTCKQLSIQWGRSIIPLEWDKVQPTCM